MQGDKPLINNIIEVENLSMTFKVPIKDEGFLASVKSLFNRKYNIVHAVKDLNLKIKRGTIHGIIGPNGAGKSTTIKMLCGILYPTTGKINSLGYIPWENREKYVKNLGTVFGQKSQLIWDLPAVDSFSLNKEMYRIPTSTYTENLESLTTLLNLNEIIYKPVRQLSLGERMKCDIVASLLHEPPLVVLDEPTIGLDIISKETIREFIKKINQQKGTTFILTTHDMSDLEDLCSNVTVINKGTIVFDDSIQELKKYYPDKKIVEVKFTNPVESFELSSFSAKLNDSFSAIIEIDLSRLELQQEIARIFEQLPVRDLNISSIAIEEVIKELYWAS